MVYERPRLERFGTFRQLTLSGRATGWDMYSVLLDSDPGDAGCTTNAGQYQNEIGCGYARS